MKRIIIRIIYALLLGVLIFIFLYAWPRVPIITAFAAKGMCSSVFIAEKDPERVSKEDLSFFPISLAKTRVNYEEKSVTATVFGLAKRVAVFREGLGAVIVLNTPKEKLMSESFTIPDPGYSQDTIPWPKGDILTGIPLEGLDYSKLETIVDGAFDPPGTEPFKKTLSVAVVYNNQLIAEKYLDGYDANTEFHGWSMTKSLTSAMVGILTGDGKMDISVPVDIPEWKDDVRGNTTLENLIHMNSGLKWIENYFTISEATLMLMQSDDMFNYVVGMPSEYPPGTNWKYSSGDANLVSGLIRKAINDDDAYHAFPYTRLMQPIGMLNTMIETDAAGNFVSSSYSYGTTRDWARFGLLYLNNGIFWGDTILPPGWVDFTRQAAPNSDGEYGGAFWLVKADPDDASADFPADMYFADGFLGQRICIIPSKNLVVVRTGYSMKNFELKNFLQDIISTLPE